MMTLNYRHQDFNLQNEADQKELYRHMIRINQLLTDPKLGIADKIDQFA